MSAPTLATILASLPPSHAAMLRRRLALPAWQARTERLAERDAALRAERDALALVGRATSVATELSRQLRRYAAAGWLQDRALTELPQGADACRKALHRVLLLNQGEALGWRRTHDLLEGRR